MKQLTPLLLFFLLNGCSLIYSYDDNLPQRINQLIIEKKYKTALNIIKHVDGKHKDYRQIQKQKKKILKTIVRYENKAITKSTQLAKQGDWVAALQYVDDVSHNLPNNVRITKHKAKLLTQRKKTITLLETEVLNRHAIDLSKKLNLYKKINKTVNPEEENELYVSEYDLQRFEISKKLASQSEHQYKDKKLDEANLSVNLALKLKPKQDVALRLLKIKKLIKKEINIKKSFHVNAAKSLLSKLSQGYSHAILKKTKETIYWLKTNRENKNSYKHLISKLNAHLNKGVKQYFKAARNLYSKEKIQEALSIWISLKELDPEYPKLKSHIKRAKKILNKLKKISNKAKLEN